MTKTNKSIKLLAASALAVTALGTAAILPTTEAQASSISVKSYNAEEKNGFLDVVTNAFKDYETANAFMKGESEKILHGNASYKAHVAPESLAPNARYIVSYDLGFADGVNSEGAESRISRSKMEALAAKVIAAADQAIAGNKPAEDTNKPAEDTNKPAEDKAPRVDKDVKVEKGEDKTLPSYDEVLKDKNTDKENGKKETSKPTEKIPNVDKDVKVEKEEDKTLPSYDEVLKDENGNKVNEDKGTSKPSEETVKVDSGVRVEKTEDEVIAAPKGVSEEKLAKLPHTGETAMLSLTASGVLIALAAGFVFVKRRRG